VTSLPRPHVDAVKAASLSEERAIDDERRDVLSPGQEIHHGRYVVHGVLGRGSFATVYDGEHLALGRPVAIKVLRAEPDSPASLHERFLREAHTSALVQHPNVLCVYDCGALEDGTPFLVLERVNGGSLTELLARGPLSITLTLELGRQLARALMALAEAGIVHRDIKPDNVMMHRTRHGFRMVKLVDFGVAKPSFVQPSARLTVQGELIGTPQYMAAEQLRGEEVDGRTDIYGVGAVLYEALTGHAPHESGTFTDFVVAALSIPVVPIKTRRPDCPPDLERVILRALHRDRSQRTATPEQLLSELDACKAELDRQRATDGADTTVAERRAAASKQKAMHLLQRGALAVGLMLTGGLGFSFLSNHAYVLEVGRPRAAHHLPPPMPSVPTAKAASPEHKGTEHRGASLASTKLPTDESRASTANARREPPNGKAVPELAAPAKTAVVPAASAKSALVAAAPGNAAASKPAEAAQLAPAKAASSAGAAVSAPTKPTPAKTASTREPTKASPESKTASAAPAKSAPAKPAAPTLSPAEVEALNASALASFVGGRLDAAKSDYLQVLRADPNQPAALRGLGLVATRLGDDALARKALQRYLSVAPSAPDAAAIKARVEALGQN